MALILYEEQLIEEQKLCLSKLTEYFNDTDKGNFTVIAPPGYGKKTMSYFLPQKLPDKKVVFSSGNFYIAQNMANELRRRSSDALCKTMQEIIEQKDILKNTDVLILHNVQFGYRRQLTKVLPDNVRVVSFITSGQEISGNEDSNFNTMEVMNSTPYIIYKTGNLIDIRDVLFAKESDKMFIDFQILQYKCSFLEKINKQLNNSNKSQTQEINQLTQIINFQDELLNCVGIPKNEISEYLDILKECKKNSYLMGESAEQQDAAVQDKIAQLLQSVREKYANRIAVSSCKNILTNHIEQSIWNKLDELTKSYLVSARYSFESMSKTDVNQKMDYSGVCLLITKAVELEVSKRFFARYKKYLFNRYGDSYHLWPKAMTAIDKNNGNSIPANVFTLGSLVHITKTNRSNICPIFLDYAKTNLFANLSHREICDEILRDCSFIEQLRLDYRNPAAHTGSFDKIGASKCFEYVIEVQRMLQKMLRNMKY